MTDRLAIPLYALLVAGAVCLGPHRPAAAETLLAAEAPGSLAELLAAFAAMPGLEAEFVEEKQLALLAAPLVSSGHIYFDPPATLARRVEAPTPSFVVITRDTLAYFDGTTTEQVDLAARPEVRDMTQSLMWILGGDLTRLEQTFELQFAATLGMWTLRLEPRTAPLTDLFTSIELTGTGFAVSTITVRETSGDTAVTRIASANPHRTFSDDDRAALFGAARP